jgi:hypothetical protein
MFARVLPRNLPARKSWRFVWRRVIRCAEPLEHRQLLSAMGAFNSALDAVLASPTANAFPLVANTIPYGDTPAQIRQAYGFNQVTFDNGTSTVTGDGSGQTIAIVDAYGDSKIASDLHNFDVQFSLPDPTLTVVNQSGGTSLPGNNSGWTLETALDVEWAHALAPNANLLLVEASNSSLGNLLAAVNYARQQPGVVAVSMSWGASEFSSETAYDSYFTTPPGHGGVTFVAASGDEGAGTSWPAVSPDVLSAGGTTLNIDTAGNYGSETAWSGSGGGLSAYESQPMYQTQSGLVTQSTTQRATPDLSYDADPNSGVAVYDSLSYSGQSGWFQVGGTSAAAPQIAAMVAVADQGRELAKGSPNPLPNAQASLYSLASNAASYSNDFHNITSGSNGSGPLDSAVAGYNLVTGLGTPKVAALVQGLVSAQATTLVTTAATTGSKPGSAVPADSPLNPTAVADIILAELLAASSQPTSIPAAIVPLGTPSSNPSTPAVSVALPSAAPSPFAVNSMLTDDPTAVPFVPAKRALPTTEVPPETQSPASNRGSHGDRWNLLDEAIDLAAWSRVSASRETFSATDAIFADDGFLSQFDSLGDATTGFVSGASFRGQEFAGLVGLIAVAALVDKSKRADVDNRPHLRAKKRIEQCA